MRNSALSQLRRQASLLLRPRPFDASTAEGRARERHRRAVLTAVASLLARAMGVLGVLITTPVVLSYLGSESFGLWLTIASATVLVGVADLGISNGLVTALSQAQGRGDDVAARRYVSSAFFMLGGVAFLFGVVFAISYPFVHWGDLFNVTTDAAKQQTGPALRTFVACTLLMLPLGLAQRVHLGLQEGFAASLWQGLGSLFSLAGTLVAVWLRGGLPGVVLGFAGGPVLAGLLNTIVLLRGRPWLLPRFRDAELGYTRWLLTKGFLFFVLQIAVLVGYQSDNVVVGRLLGADQVTQFAVPARLYFLVPSLLGLLWMPMWPAYGEAMTRGDLGWVKRTLRRSFMAAVAVSVVAAAALSVGGRMVLELWVGRAVEPTPLLLVALTVWMIIASALGPLAMFFNGAGVVRFLAICATLAMIANLLISIVLTNLIGISGPAWGSGISQAVFVLIPSAFYIPRLLSHLSSGLLKKDHQGAGRIMGEPLDTSDLERRG
jgi:O-antigen/teichoic acid export membrane protein